VTATDKQRLRIGTRDSVLARLQTDMVVAALNGLGQAIEIEIVAQKTSGDKILDKPIAELGSTGVFVKELEDELLQQRVDLVVHSLKDLPTELPDGLVLAAVLKRDDPRDAFLSASGQPFAKMPAGSRIATSSRRRAAQLGVLRPDVSFVDVRGNVQTRLRKLDEGQCDAMVLAAAGLIRLGYQERIVELFDTDTSVPAAGQGALAVECRAADTKVRQLLASINDGQVQAEVSAERAFLKYLGGGCSVPIGVLGRLDHSGNLTLHACVADGKQMVKASTWGPSADGENLGIKLAKKILSDGADKILSKASQASPQTVSPP
jgi:hydroxymethylbilane synthase